jgi:hypothetical protein
MEPTLTQVSRGFTKNIRLSCKGLPVTNALAYFGLLVSDEEKSEIILTPGHLKSRVQRFSKTQR